MDKKLILIVDDEPLICSELAGYLSQKGYHMIIANNGEDGYNLFVTQNPICVLTDYDMPLMNGLDLLKKIKQGNKAIHVILMSGVANVKVVTEAMKNEAFDFLAKPIDLKELLLIVDIAIKKTLSWTERAKEEKISSFIYHSINEKKNFVSLLYFNRDLDEYNSPLFNNYIKSMLSDGYLQKHVVFILENTNYINNVGLGFLIDIKNTIEQSGKKFLIILGKTNQVSSYIKTLGFDSFLNVRINLDDYLMSLGETADSIKE